MTSKRELLKRLDTLCTLKKCSTRNHRGVLNHIDTHAIDLISEAAFNVIQSSKKKLGGNKIEKLKKFQRELVYLSKPKNSHTKKKELISSQSGSGLITLLLSVSFF